MPEFLNLHGVYHLAFPHFLKSNGEDAFVIKDRSQLV